MMGMVWWRSHLLVELSSLHVQIHQPLEAVDDATPIPICLGKHPVELDGLQRVQLQVVKRQLVRVVSVLRLYSFAQVVVYVLGEFHRQPLVLVLLLPVLIIYSLIEFLFDYFCSPP